ncbi:MAG: O-antigen ligase family protein [Glaciimonas sp.]|nr:O-antigen ligase family protein [Glaciimonas sp.]
MKSQPLTKGAFSTEELRLKKLPTWPAVSIFLLVVISAILPPGLLTGMNLYLLLLAFIAWVASRKPFDRNLLRIVAPFIFIIVIGLIVGVGSDQYLYLKDAWYVSNAAVLFCVGYVFYRNKPDTARGLRAFVLGGTTVAVFYLVRLAMHPELFSLSAAELRESAGTGYYAPVLSFSILCCFFKDWKNGLKIGRLFGATCLLICLLSIFASFSRTIFLVAIIGVMAAVGIFTGKEVFRVAVVILIGAVLIVILRLSINTNSPDATKSFLGKVARSTEELTVENYDDLKSININWRGYETSRALIYYSSGNPMNWLVGYGFGAQVDLGLMMPLGSGPRGERTPIQFVPILHNGFAYLLVKGGAIAVCLFMSVIIWLYLLGRRSAIDSDRHRRASARLLQAIAISTAFTTYVIAGAFNKLDLFSFLLAIGFLIASLTSPKRESHEK